MSRDIAAEVKAEAAELRERIDRLDDFICSPGSAYADLPQAHKRLLNRQVAAQRALLLILRERIELYPA